MTQETRTHTGRIEIRKRGDGTPVVEGYAAVFDEETIIGGERFGFREVVRAGAFKEALARPDDVRFLINHGDLPLARTKSGTLRLEEDKHGLRIEAELDPNDPDVQRMIPKMERGDLTQMSFAFQTSGEESEVWKLAADDSDELDLREIRNVTLYDVSAVTYPAYEGTEVGLRNRDKKRDEEQAKREREKQAAQARSGYAYRKALTEQKARGL